MSNDRLHQPIVATAVDQLTRARTSEDAGPTLPSLEELTGACADAASTLDLGEKWRWWLHESARMTAAYLRFLQPPVGWWRAASRSADGLDLR